MTELRELLLTTLSFFRPMSREEILLSLDRDQIEQRRDLTMGELDDELRQLVRERKLKMTRVKGEIFYLRTMPRRSFRKQILLFFSRFF